MYYSDRIRSMNKLAFTKLVLGLQDLKMNFALLNMCNWRQLNL
jgi:hypothetical protein